MITVTRLNKTQFDVNPDLIERVHANPDTTLVMIDGSKLVISETREQVRTLILQYRASVIHLARGLALEPTPGPVHLTAVPSAGD